MGWAGITLILGSLSSACSGQLIEDCVRGELDLRYCDRDGDLVARAPKVKAARHHALLEIARAIARRVRIAADNVELGWGFALQDFLQGDEKVGGGWGVVLDDLIAGAMACGVMHLGFFIVGGWW